MRRPAPEGVRRSKPVLGVGTLTLGRKRGNPQEQSGMLVGSVDRQESGVVSFTRARERRIVNVKPFIGTLRVISPFRQSRARAGTSCVGG